MPSIGATSGNGSPSFWRGLSVQGRVIGSLIMRELNGRYGRENIGYLWLIGEPFLLASVITLIHLEQPNHFSSDIAPAPFAILGYTIYIIFRGIVNKSEGLVERNQELFYHRTVSILDVVLARALIEAVGCFATTVVLMTFAILAGLADLPVRPLSLLAAVGMMIWWSLAISLIVVNITYRNELIGRQVHVFTYVSIPVSGAFYQLSSVPLSFAAILKWWPMAIIFEQARYGQFQFASARYVNPAYVCAVCACLTYVGLVLIARLRQRL